MYPPAPGFLKQSYSGMKLAGYSIPEGSRIMVCMHGGKIVLERFVGDVRLSVS